MIFSVHFDHQKERGNMKSSKKVNICCLHLEYVNDNLSFRNNIFSYSILGL